MRLFYMWFSVQLGIERGEVVIFNIFLTLYGLNNESVIQTSIDRLSSRRNSHYCSHRSCTILTILRLACLLLW